LEACEYQRHFLTLDIDEAIITSLELEHTDYFKDWEDYQSAFLELIEKLKGHAYVLPSLNSEKILNHEKTVIIPPQVFDFQHIRGEYQQQNASLVYGLLNALMNETYTGLPRPNGLAMTIKKQIEGFHGIRRRMEEVATTAKGAKIFSDYGHMASSLEGGLKALKERFPEKQIICIFQPHQMHRILQGWNDFPKALAEYDQTFIYDIYAAREKSDVQSVEELGEAFAKHTKSTYLKEFVEVEKIIEKADQNDIIVVYSAGDIDYLLRKYLQLC
jgi:UDP-N-acetylmuramate--alanine ligase